MKKKSANYLTYIPVHNESYRFKINEDGLVTIFKENTGVMNRLAQKFLGKPEISSIHLDRMGSFIWNEIDGRKNLIEIAESVKGEFGPEAEPLYERLVQYVRTLERCGFIYVRPSGD